LFHQISKNFQKTIIIIVSIIFFTRIIAEENTDKVFLKLAILPVYNNTGSGDYNWLKQVIGDYVKDLIIDNYEFELISSENELDLVSDDFEVDSVLSERLGDYATEINCDILILETYRLERPKEFNIVPKEDKKIEITTIIYSNILKKIIGKVSQIGPSSSKIFLTLDKISLKILHYLYKLLIGKTEEPPKFIKTKLSLVIIPANFGSDKNDSNSIKEKKESVNIVTEDLTKTKNYIKGKNQKLLIDEIANYKNKIKNEFDGNVYFLGEFLSKKKIPSKQKNELIKLIIEEKKTDISLWFAKNNIRDILLLYLKNNTFFPSFLSAGIETNISKYSTTSDVTGKKHDTLISVIEKNNYPKKNNIIKQKKYPLIKKTSLKQQTENESKTYTDEQKKIMKVDFGMYGRISVDDDLHGSPGYTPNVVFPGPRIFERPYQEYYMFFRFPKKPGLPEFEIVSTLAMSENRFHYNGKFDADLAIRNLYISVNDIFLKTLDLWVGSRMYRGDDIYLLDFWPLDNLNTVGAGTNYTFNGTQFALHMGMNRLDDPFHYKQFTVPKADFGTEEWEVTNRQRMIVSLKSNIPLSKYVNNFGLPSKYAFKVKLYSELHRIPEAISRTQYAVEYREEYLPSEFGWLAGWQAGFWGFERNSFVNLFMKYAKGIAAYGELAVPSEPSPQNEYGPANKFLTGLSGNYEWKKLIGVMLGGYLRKFEDADISEYDTDDSWDLVTVVRTYWFFTRYFHPGMELSYQRKVTYGLSPETGKHFIPQAYTAALIPTIAPNGIGTYSRPHIRLTYAITYLNSSGRQMFPVEDRRRNEGIHHFFSIGAEWWFNSLY
jgi:maltoporin